MQTEIGKIGQAPKALAQKMAAAKAVEPLKKYPVANVGFGVSEDFPDSLSFVQGEILHGKYMLTKRVYSESFNNPKIEKITGRGYRDQHVFQDAEDQTFGIWNVGVLGNILTRVKRGTVLAIRYDGLAAEPLKKGQNPPHTFTFLTEDGKNLIVDAYAPSVIDGIGGGEDLAAAPDAKND